MSTYVLVGGAWIGAWAWRETTRALREGGHRVYPLSLTGLAERSHLGGRDVNADTHITDIVNLIETEDLTDVILVGHSYAGAIPVPGAAHRVGERLSHVVYLDSAPMGDGQAMTDLMPPEAVTDLTAAINEQGEGWRFGFPSIADLSAQSSISGLDEQTLERMTRKATDHPFGTYTQPLSLPGRPSGQPQQVIIACEDFHALLASGNPWLESLVDDSWRRFDLATGHWPMLSQPLALAETLGAIAG